MGTLDEAQLTYLTDVLGIRGVVLPTALEIPVATQGAPVSSAPTFVTETPVRTRGDLASSALFCLFQKRDGWTLEGAADELARKMIQAMKLADADVYWMEWVAPDHAPAPEEVLDSVSSAGFRPVLCFGKGALDAVAGQGSALGRWHEFHGVRVLGTHSLEELLAQPQLKKPAWAHLQTVMKVIE